MTDRRANAPSETQTWKVGDEAITAENEYVVLIRHIDQPFYIRAIASGELDELTGEDVVAWADELKRTLGHQEGK